MLQLFFLLFPSSAGNFLFSILRTNMEMHCRMKHVIRIYLSFTAEPILPPSAHFVLFRAKSTDDSSKLLIAFKNPLPFFLTPQLENGFVRLLKSNKCKATLFKAWSHFQAAKHVLPRALKIRYLSPIR